MVRVTTTIDLSGPLFRADIRKTVRQNIRTMMEAIAAEGQSDVVAQYRAGQGGRQPIAMLGDRVADHIHGRVASVNGKDWYLNAVISVNNSGFSSDEGISLMAAASNVEGRVHGFRKTKNRLGRARALNVAELVKGLT